MKSLALALLAGTILAGPALAQDMPSMAPDRDVSGTYLITKTGGQPSQQSMAMEYSKSSGTLRVNVGDERLRPARAFHRSCDFNRGLHVGSGRERERTGLSSLKLGFVDPTGEFANVDSAAYMVAPAFGAPASLGWDAPTVQLTDAQVADVVNYVRSHFGNRYKERVSAAQVAQLPHPTAAAAP